MGKMESERTAMIVMDDRHEQKLVELKIILDNGDIILTGQF